MLYFSLIQGFVFFVVPLGTWFHYPGNGRQTGPQNLAHYGTLFCSIMLLEKSRNTTPLIYPRGLGSCLVLLLYTREETMAVHPCPRCGRLIPVGVQYCDTCRPVVEAELEAYRLEKIRHRDAAYNRRRDPKYLQFYRSKDWRTLSQAYLQAARYKCEAHACPGCTGLAVEVHHKKPIQTPEGWELRLDWDNLEAVCTQCHNARHPEKGKAQTPAGVIDLKNLQI